MVDPMLAEIGFQVRVTMAWFSFERVGSSGGYGTMDIT